MVLPKYRLTDIQIGLLAFVLGCVLCLAGLFFVHWLTPFILLVFGGLVLAGGSEAMKNKEFELATRMRVVGVAFILCPLATIGLFLFIFYVVHDL